MARFFSNRRWLFVWTTIAVLATYLAQAAAAESPRQDQADKPGDVYQTFFAKPGKENYLRANKATTTSKTYNPYSNELNDIRELIDDGKYADARSRLKKCMPEFMLSPQAHQLSSQVEKQLGAAAAAKREAELAKKCIDGILSTGDGSDKKPYLVARVSDEYDVLSHLGKTMVQQGLMHKNGKACDQIQCRDGTVLWFDVSSLFAAFMK